MNLWEHTLFLGYVCGGLLASAVLHFGSPDGGIWPIPLGGIISWLGIILWKSGKHEES